MSELTPEQISRKRNDKHAKHEAENKQERKEKKHKLPTQLDWVDATWVDHNESE